MKIQEAKKPAYYRLTVGRFAWGLNCNYTDTRRRQINCFRTPKEKWRQDLHTSYSISFLHASLVLTAFFDSININTLLLFYFILFY